MEIWKDVIGFEGLYKVSNLGRVLSVKKDKILSPELTNLGYLRVQLYKNKSKKNFRIHRLVAEAFIPNPENKKEVNHINEIKTDNKVLNLEWSTRKENVNHGTSIKRMVEKQSKPIIVYSANGDFISKFSSLSETSKKLNINISKISKCANGKIDSVNNYIFKFAS